MASPRIFAPRADWRADPATESVAIPVLSRPAVDIDEARGLAICPAGPTHSRLGADVPRASGSLEGYVRFSIGLEHSDGHLADLDQAPASAGNRARSA
ncbi:PLP-dependent transferase (plasmid) [Methylobacterium sp. NMS14P]|nr:PLP-dependent transferase [Methylobacterium sp. NMS14P]WCS28716.1 PLP-dependent transferase [Methylobacterium sp. NMS14P]